jgi:hypothetical protein
MVEEKLVGPAGYGEPERLAIMAERLAVISLQGMELTLFRDAQAKLFHG